MSDVGFTGTQDGMTVKQALSVLRFCREHLRYPSVVNVHHGDCIGADEEFDYIAYTVRSSENHNIGIIGHPPDNPSKRAFCEHFDVVMPEKPYLERNHDIVDSCGILLAAPSSTLETLRSGTWATIRYARSKRKPIWIVWPDGTSIEESPPSLYDFREPAF